jgi:predicted nucleic acid-binding Zn ribbon protein
VSGRGGGRRAGKDRGDRTLEPALIGQVVDGLLVRREFARGMPLGRLAREWPRVVGDRLAAVSTPVRLEAGTLVVAATSGAWGAQVKFLAEDIGKRANETLGKEAVKRVRVVVDEAAPEQ